METVLIDKVFAANDYGFVDVKLGDGRKVSTRDQKTIDALEANRGQEVTAEITEKQKGDYTNFYIGKVNAGSGNGAAQTAFQKIAATNTTPAAKHPSVVAQDEKGERIARQWAYGRAVEMGIASGDLAFPLDDDSVAKLKISAEVLLTLTR